MDKRNQKLGLVSFCLFFVNKLEDFSGCFTDIFDTFLFWFENGLQ